LASDSHPAAQFLSELNARLSAVTPDRYKTPEWDRPRGRLRLLGTATEYQKILSTVAETANDEHAVLHKAMDLEFGAHAGLAVEHRTLHVVSRLAGFLLFEDLTNTFEELGAEQVYIDPNWNVYRVERGLLARLMQLFGAP